MRTITISVKEYRELKAFKETAMRVIERLTDPKYQMDYHLMMKAFESPEKPNIDEII